MKIIGILGGTFDPVHLGHLQLADNALRRLRLDSIRCLPAGQPVHRELPQASPQDRLAMVRIAFAKQNRCFIDDTEIYQPSPSWTIKTLERLWYEESNVTHVLIIGADVFLNLPSWHRWCELPNYGHIAVASRPGNNVTTVLMPQTLKNFYRARYTQNLLELSRQRSGKLVFFDIKACTVSATKIRKHLSLGLPITDMLPAVIENYARRIYKKKENTERLTREIQHCVHSIKSRVHMNFS